MSVLNIGNENNSFDFIAEVEKLKELDKYNEYPILCVDGCPIAHIEHIDGVPIPDSVKRAKYAVKSFFDSNKKFSILPSSEFSWFDHKRYGKESSDEHYEEQLCEFDIECIGKKGTKVDTYNLKNKPHLLVYVNKDTIEEKKFNIWDHKLIVEIAVRHNQTSSRLDKINRDSPFFYEILRNVD